MSVLFRVASGVRRFLSPQCAVARLRMLYFTALALCGAFGLGCGSIQYAVYQL